MLEALGGGSSAEEALAFRKRCAWKAFQHCATYDRWAACTCTRRSFMVLTFGAPAGLEATRLVLPRLSHRERARARQAGPGTPPNAHTASAPAPLVLPRSTVAEWLWGQVGEGPAPEMSVPMRLAQGLRYGENPHQEAAFYTDASLAGEPPLWGPAPRAVCVCGFFWSSVGRTDMRCCLLCAFRFQRQRQGPLRPCCERRQQGGLAVPGGVDSALDVLLLLWDGSGKELVGCCKPCAAVAPARASAAWLVAVPRLGLL